MAYAISPTILFRVYVFYRQLLDPYIEFIIHYYPVFMVEVIRYGRPLFYDHRRLARFDPVSLLRP